MLWIPCFLIKKNVVKPCGTPVFLKKTLWNLSFLVYNFIKPQVSYRRFGGSQVFLSKLGGSQIIL